MAKKKQVKKTKRKAATARQTKPKSKPKAKKASARPKARAKKKAKQKPVQKRSRGRAGSAELVGYQPRGLGAVVGGQSGDIQGISGALRADSESVEELLEEGQTFEAQAVAGVENAPDPDESEVVTHQVPEDDVPEEYRERDE
jgi:hypothetical protein